MKLKCGRQRKLAVTYDFTDLIELLRVLEVMGYRIAPSEVRQ